jgi:hypothetical protein
MMRLRAYHRNSSLFIRAPYTLYSADGGYRISYNNIIHNFFLINRHYFKIIALLGQYFTHIGEPTPLLMQSSHFIAAPPGPAMTAP